MRKISFLSVLLITATMFVACGDSGSSDEGEGGGGGGSATYEGNDKDFLDKTGQQLVSSFGKNDFDNFKPIRQALENRNYDASAIEDRFDIDNLKQLVSSVGSTNYYKTLLQASKFYGDYTVVNNRWQYSSNSTRCQFVFSDENNQQIVVTATKSGAEKNIYIMQERDRRYNYSSQSYDYEYNEIGVAVPERIEATVTQAGRTIISVVATFNLTNIIENGKYDLSRNNLDVTTKVVINEKYTVNVSKASYVANGQSSASFSISNGSTTIVSGSASASTQISNQGYDDVNVNSLTNINASLDILGNVQIKAQCSDGIALRDAIDNADDNKYDETAFNNALLQVNSKYSANVYYNNNNTVRATLTLGAYGKPYYRYPSGNVTRWESKPIITFMSDNSTYAFDDYFTDSAFPTVWNNFKDLVNTVARNFTDERIDW